ncbi:MAG: hypothetical protein J7M38_00195 [Armatimonadetes bacterium]|nr:hypothetical protein [Armatimonadota bacterium]
MAADPIREPRGPEGLRVSGRELLLVLVWSLLVVGLTVLPYLWAISLTGPGAPWEGYQFQGFMWGVDEGNVYLAWMRQAAEGKVLLRNQYTIFPQNPQFFNVFILGCGRLMALTGQPAAVIFHVMRLVGGVVLLIGIYLLAAWLSDRPAVRWGALCLASLGSGLGWLAAVWADALPAYLPPPLRTPDYAPPLERTWQTMPEAVTFLSILLNPLFVWSMALLCLFFITALASFELRRIRWAFVAGVILLVLGNIHTYDVFVAHAALLLYVLVLLVRRDLSWGRAAVTYAVILALSIASPLWAWHGAQLDPAWLAKINTPTLSPRPVDYIAGYGLVFALALLGAAWALAHRERQRRLLFPACWVAVNFLLVYAPVSFQRKMAEGLHIPLCILAAVGLAMVIAPRLRSRERGHSRIGLLIALAVALMLPSNAMFVAAIMQQTGANNMTLLRWLQPPAYLPWDEVEAMQYLAEHTGEDDVVFSSSLTGSHIPPRAPCTVFVGHWAETLHFSEMLTQVGNFLLPGRSEQIRSAILRQAGAQWVYYGSYETLMARQMMVSAELKPPEDPAAEFRRNTRDILEPVFSNDTVTIYRTLSVLAPPPPGPDERTPEAMTAPVTAP